MNADSSLQDLPAPTNAASSGIKIDRKVLKQLMRRSDRKGLRYLGVWAVALSITGIPVWFAVGTPWMWPAMFIYGTVLTLPAYSISHETAHGTPFRTRWLNEFVLWFTSLIYMEEPLHRRYAHTNHHTYTWHVGRDSQMPFDTPMLLKGWLDEVSGFALLRYEVKTLFRLAFAGYSQTVRMVTPAGELAKLTGNARVFLAVYVAIAVLIAKGVMWPLWFIVLPRILGAPIMALYGLIQHVEMQENAASILDSTRSFRTNLLSRFLYANMNYHVEHHLFPQIPFYNLPALSRTIADQLPAPDPGFVRTNWEVLGVVLRRSLGRNTKAASIRQAPHMITEGGFTTIARASMR